MDDNKTTPPIDELEQEKREAAVLMSREQWAKFDIWMKRNGCQSLAEGFRTAIREITSGRAACQAQNGSTQ